VAKALNISLKEAAKYNHRKTWSYDKRKIALKGLSRNFLPDVYSTKAKCEKHEERVGKEFLVANEVKANFCYDLIDELSNFDNKKLLGFLPTLKNV